MFGIPNISPGFVGGDQNIPPFDVQWLHLYLKDNHLSWRFGDKDIHKKGIQKQIWGANFTSVYQRT
jgi:hypothetical protein